MKMSMLKWTECLICNWSFSGPSSILWAIEEIVFVYLRKKSRERTGMLWAVVSYCMRQSVMDDRRSPLAVHSLSVLNLGGGHSCDEKEEMGLYCLCGGSVRRYIVICYGVEAHRVERDGAIRSELCFIFTHC